MYRCRKDNQIKHLGRRIEPGEIETAAQSLTGVEACCVIYDDAHKKLILAVEGTADDETITAGLAKLLPGYMIPSKIVHLENLPRTQNGKTDRLKIRKLLIS